MAASNLRCIAFAHKHIEDDEEEDKDEETQRQMPLDCLTLVGIVGLEDPCRPGVKNAVEASKLAGLKIKMITGDNIFTAKAMATACGILEPNDEEIDDDGAILEGEVFRSYTEEDRLEKVDRIRIMARSSPLDKLLMVQSLRKKGHVVGMLGDGPNDVLALKEADVGVSIGSQGTQLAIRSSQIVLLDGNFASIVTFVEWGRCVYTNMQRFIQFQLTTDLVWLVMSFIEAASSREMPLPMFQYIWINLVMDTLWGLAFALEKPSKDLLEEPPVGQTEPLTTNVVWRNLVAQAMYQILVLSIFLFETLLVSGITKDENKAMFFNIFVFCQVANALNSRKLERKNVFQGMHNNKLVAGAISGSVVIHVMIVWIQNVFLDMERIKLWQWGACTGFAVMCLPIGWLVKLIPTPKKPNWFPRS